MAKKAIRIFEGNAQPHEPFWAWRDAVDDDGPEMEFYGFISEYSWYEDDITPRIFKDDLNRVGKGGPVRVRIHSGGGDVWAASVIRATIVDYPGRVTVQIDGLCASAATIVALAGDVIRMQDSAYMMIHDPWTITWGNIEEIKTALEQLKNCKDGILDGYMARAKVSRDKLAKMMTDETWLTAKEAQDIGFVDEVVGVPGTKAAVSQAVLANAIGNFVNVPAALLALMRTDEPVIDQQAADVLRAEVNSILLVRGTV